MHAHWLIGWLLVDVMVVVVVVVVGFGRGGVAMTTSLLVCLLDSSFVWRVAWRFVLADALLILGWLSDL